MWDKWRSFWERKGHPFWKRLTSHMQPTVFFGSALVVILLVAFGGGFTSTAQDVFGATKSGIAKNFGWFYVLVTTALLVFVIVLAVSPAGNVRLGRRTDEPEFRTITWLAMLFAAGMGTGLVFFGVAEPMIHWNNPPMGSDPRSDEALLEAMRLSFFHWGIHPWAIYITLGAALTLLHFRYRLPLAPRSLLWPLIGKRIYGPIGHGIDILCTVGTLIGVAASLGLGALQLNNGIERLGLASYSRGVQLSIIGTITLIATISVVSGIHRGIRRLSQFNLMLASFLLLFVLFTGPTIFMANLGVTSLGEYLNNLIGMSMWAAPTTESARAWQEEWTFSYWGWWLAWSPFVGIFVARISKGRTLREFVFAILMVPVLLSFVWFAVFGGAGLALARGEFGNVGPQFADEIVKTPAIALHAVFEQLPLATLTGLLTTLLIAVFFVTSSDSGSLVDDIVTSGGDPNPPRAQRVFWAVSEGVLAAALLVTDGIAALRAAAITVGLPMCLLLLASAASLYKLAFARRRTGLRGFTKPPRKSRQTSSAKSGLNAGTNAKPAVHVGS